MKKLVLSLLLVIITACTLRAQDTLPKFLVKNVRNNRIVISWTNTFQNIRQISIQRSFDSLINYKTILTVLDPSIPQNGYVDTKATNDHMFYRLYILQDRGVYFFTAAKRPTLDTVHKTDTPFTTETIKRIDSIANPWNNPVHEQVIDTAYITFPEVVVKNKPTGFVPSEYVYTQKDGYVQVNLPAEENPAAGSKTGKKYSIKFFGEDDTFLFELKDIKNSSFKIDKTNFYHAGWFKFELYEDGKLFEKHKFYLGKDF